MRSITYFDFFRICLISLLISGLVSSLLGCNSSRQNKDQVTLDSGSSIQKDLLGVVQMHISEHDGYFIDKEWLYYNVLFWNTDGKSYMTIWTFVTYPNYIKDCFPDQTVLLGIEQINERKVVFISPERTLEVYNPSESSISSATLESKKPFEGPIYDGLLYEATYYLDTSDQDVVSFKYVENNFPVLNCIDLNNAIEIDE